jgi:hypothetical protein
MQLEFEEVHCIGASRGADDLGIQKAQLVEIAEITTVIDEE